VKLDLGKSFGEGGKFLIIEKAHLKRMKFKGELYQKRKDYTQHRGFALRGAPDVTERTVSRRATSIRKGTSEVRQGDRQGKKSLGLTGGNLS